MQPEIDYIKIGQRIKAARQEKGYSQADLGALVGCSNNHMSHVEVGQTKVSLAMLLKLAFVLEKNFDYFLLDTPYAKCDSIIDDEIAAKLKATKSTAAEQLVDIRDVKIDRSLPSEERIKSFIEQIKNPYQFKVGNTVVRVSFANTQNTITDNFINMIASM